MQIARVAALEPCHSNLSKREERLPGWVDGAHGCRTLEGEEAEGEATGRHSTLLPAGSIQISFNCAALSCLRESFSPLTYKLSITRHMAMTGFKC